MKHKTFTVAFAWGTVLCLGMLLGAQGSTPQDATQQADRTAAAVPAAVRGQKLMLKDGSFQLVRTYERNGDRVRYLSAERGAWEELPSAMVDWDGTAKAAAAEASAASALVKNVHQQQVESQAEVPIDVDASLRVGTGVFLPSGEGIFAVQGKTVTKLEQAGSQSKVDKKVLMEQVISPLPIIPSKRNIVIPGAHAKVRVTRSTEPLEFFLREPPPDPDSRPPVINSTGTSDSGPEVELLRVTVKGGKRELESIRSLFGEKVGASANVISMQRWDVAPMLYRFTLSETLAPGEYALAELNPDGLNVWVWDFGMDGTATAPGR